MTTQKRIVISGAALLLVVVLLIAIGFQPGPVTGMGGALAAFIAWRATAGREG